MSSRPQVLDKSGLHDENLFRSIHGIPLGRTRNGSAERLARRRRPPPRSCRHHPRFSSAAMASMISSMVMLTDFQRFFTRVFRSCHLFLTIYGRDHSLAQSTLSARETAAEKA